ncbi:hypothetical protein KY285_010782 [Solanum tuberosum]|nr:hypothetical protein KY289_011359 [Solanum tuberosum]KAH0735075.1 hypothetical protein KY285_010782 [Solanum tuberosum]
MRGESTTPHPSQRPTLDEVVIAKELHAEEPQGERASAAPNDQKEPLLKGVVIQRPPLEELLTREGESSISHHSKRPTLDELVITREGESAIPHHSKRPTLDELLVIDEELPEEELPQEEGASSTPNHQETPLTTCKRVTPRRTSITCSKLSRRTIVKTCCYSRPPLEELCTGEGDSTTLHPSQGSTLDELVIAKELCAQELHQREGASAAQNHQEEPLLKRVIIQSPPLGELFTGDGESATPHPSQGPTLDELVIAKELPAAEELPKGEGASVAPNDQEEPQLKGVVI